mmetsp:Transcript_109043/g.305187  ORF Transcript_109043/g.305187 Transcript_109043/m.305187 type:complete len:109 (-) Transcript_109043:1327-1653(-)
MPSQSPAVDFGACPILGDASSAEGGPFLRQIMKNQARVTAMVAIHHRGCLLRICLSMVRKIRCFHRALLLPINIIINNSNNTIHSTDNHPRRCIQTNLLLFLQIMEMP